MVWMRLSQPPMRQGVEELIESVSVRVQPYRVDESRSFPIVRVRYANWAWAYWEVGPLSFNASLWKMRQ